MLMIKPQSEVEKQVLASCLNDLDSIFYALDYIKPADFHIKKNQKLFQYLIQAAFDLKDNCATDVFTYLQTKIGKDDYDISEIIKIASLIASGSNIGYFTKQLKNYSQLRKFFDLLVRTQSMIKNGEFDFQKVMSIFENEYLTLLDVYSFELDIPKLAENTFERIIETKENNLSGFSWGLKELDVITGGIEKSKSYVIGGLKKSGKTKFLINTQVSLFHQNIRVGWISLEMSAKNLMRWIFGRLAHVDSDKIKSGFVSDEEIERLRKVTEWIINNKQLIYIDDRAALDILQVRSLIRKWSKLGVQVVFLDYLQRLKIETIKGENRATAIQGVTIELADIAKEYNIALIYLSQLKNEAEGRIAGIADLKESGGIGESVDCAIIINNLDRINRSKIKQNKAKLIIEQRDGTSDVIELYSRLRYSEYLNFSPDVQINQECIDIDLPTKRITQYNLKIEGDC